MVSERRKAYWKKCKHGHNAAKCATCQTELQKEVSEKVRLEKEFQEKYQTGSLQTFQEPDSPILRREKIQKPIQNKPADSKRFWTCKLCGQGIYKGQKTVETFDEVYHKECCEPCNHEAKHLIITKYRICPACNKAICIKCKSSYCPSSKS